jgi:hypothetical protein
MLRISRSIACVLVAGGIAAGTVAPGAVAAPAHMPWSVLSRFGGDADGNGRLDRPTPRALAGLDVFPVAVRPSRGLCDSVGTATWLVDGRKATGVEVKSGRRCRVLVPVAGEGRHTIAARAQDRKEIASIDIDDRLIVALGDSVASGEGNPVGKDLWLDVPCHRSALAGFEQAARLLGQAVAEAPASRSPASSITFVSLACSGAKVGAGLLRPYAGVDPDDRLPPYRPQVERLRRIADARAAPRGDRSAVDAVLVSVGANDVRFSDVVKACAAPGDCRAGQEAGVLAGLERLRGAYDRLGRRLDLAAPGAPVLSVEYFDPTHDEEGRFCRHSVAFTTQDEARWAYEGLLRPLNAEIEAAAERNRWLFVDGIAADFERHGYCAGADRWVRRLSDSAIFQHDLLGTLHPSPDGQAAIARRVVVPLAGVLGLRSPTPEPAESEPSLLDRIDLGPLVDLVTEPTTAWPWWLFRLPLLVGALGILLFVLVRLRRFLRRTAPDPDEPAAERFPELPSLPGNTELQKLLLLAGSAIAQLGAAVVFAGIVGGAILWLRFWSSHLPADQAVDVVSKGELVVTGTQALALFFVLSLLAVGVAWLLDGNAQATRPTRLGLVSIGLAEMLAAIAIGEFPRDQAVRLFVGLIAASLFFHYLLDRALTHWTERRKEARCPSYRPPRQRPRDLIRRTFETPAAGLLKRVAAVAWRALPLALLALAVVLSLVLDGPTRNAILPLFFLAFLLFVAPGGMAAAATERNPPADAAQGLVLPRIALASGGIFCVFILIARDEWWLAVTAAIALALGLVCLVVAGLSKARFAPYGIAVLISVPLFGASAALLRGIDSPELQPVAAILKDGKAVCGVYIGQSGGRLWMGRLELDERASVKPPRRGDIVSFDSDRVTALAVGPLEPVARAQGRAVELRDGLLDEHGATDPAERAPSCTPPKPEVKVDRSWQRRLAERFQPELIVDREDGFWPVPVKTLFSMQDRRAAICRGVGSDDGGCLRLSTQGQFPWAGGDGEWLEYPAANTSRGDQHDLMVNALGSSDPDATATVYFLVAGDRHGNRPITIQYWFFYSFNYQPIRGGTILGGGYHEGDFESIGVLLSGKRERPRYLWMARHDKEGRVFPWNDDALTIAGEHPTVFVARGSHASYESCGAQVRYVARYGLVDDHPTCDEDRQLHLAPEATPVTDLSRVAWGCWHGLFGHKNENRSYEQIPYLVSDAPRSPLWQQSFGGVLSEPCRGVHDPGDREGPGEEVVEESNGVPARLRARAGRLEPLVDQCADWESPPPTGIYMVACDQSALDSYLASSLEDPGTAGVRIDVARADGPKVGEYALPAIRRNRDGVYLDGWRLVAAKRGVVSVFASCPRNGAIVAASFSHVVVEPSRPLRLRDRGFGRRWVLTEPDGSPASTAVPFPTREEGGRLVAARRKPGQTLACGGA